MRQYLEETPLLNFSHPSLTTLIRDRQWQSLPEEARVGAIYGFVQNDIAFGYNAADDISASEVLRDGHGQCNTKGTLLMALLRACGVRCRFHGFTIDKPLQRGAATGVGYLLAPRNIVHSWVEVEVNGQWINLEGVILDQAYLRSLQTRFARQEGAFCGYGVATPNLKNPAIEWKGTSTYIQKDGINHDFGLFDSPDQFYAAHGGNLSGLKRLLFQRYFRHQMNANVAKVRRGEW